MAFDYRMSSGPLQYTNYQLKQIKLPHNCKLPETIDACIERLDLDMLEFDVAEETIANFEERQETRQKREQERKERLFRSPRSIAEEEQRLRDNLQSSIQPQVLPTEEEKNTDDEFSVKEAKILEFMELKSLDRNTAIFCLECTGFDVQAAAEFADMNLN